MKPRVAEALSGDDVTDAVETVAAVVLAVLAVRPVGAAHLAPVAHRRNVVITVMLQLSSVSHSHHHHRMEMCYRSFELKTLNEKKLFFYTF